MAGNILFKSVAFGGFKKDDVLNYIEGLLAEKCELGKKLSDANKELEEASLKAMRVDECEAVLESIRAELACVKEEKEGLDKSVNDKDSLIDELTKRLSDCERTDDLKEEIERLKAENTKLKEDSERSKELERQVGAAMLDARVHSEGLVESAKIRANDVTKAIYNAIGETAVKIDDLSTGISDIARCFTKSAEEIELRIKVLTGDMSKTAQALLSENFLLEENHESADKKPLEEKFIYSDIPSVGKDNE